MALKDRTKLLIAESLIELNKKRHLSKITVSDIVNISGINRNTFYYYFKDKNDLVSWVYINTVNENFKSDKDVFGHPYTVKVFNIIKEQRKLYKEAFEENGANSFENYINKYWLDVYIGFLRGKLVSEPTNKDIFAVKTFSYSRVALLKEWVMDDCKMDTEEFVTHMLADVPTCLEGMSYKKYD